MECPVCVIDKSNEHVEYHNGEEDSEEVDVELAEVPDNFGCL